VIDPHHVRTIEGDSITSPYVVRVDVRDVNVLNDDVARTRDDTKTFALDNAATTLANDRLVRVDRDAKNASIVVCHGRGRRIWLVVLAPSILQCQYL
jgi:hypothetical protein